jgi:hypothetical protein
MVKNIIVDLMVSEMNKEGFDRVYTENVSVCTLLITLF